MARTFLRGRRVPTPALDSAVGRDGEVRKRLHPAQPSPFPVRATSASPGTVAFDPAEAWRQLTSLSSVAPEMAHPIATIRAYAEAALSMDHVNGSAKPLRRILDQARHLEDLLGLLVEEAGHAAPRPARLDLAEVLRSVLDELPARPGRRVQVHALEAELDADELTLRRTVGALVTSVLAITESDVQVTVHSTTDDARLMVAAVDLNPAVPAPAGGPDLRRALSMAQQLAAVHRGTLSLRPRLGGGATVSLSLPRRAPHIIELAAAALPSPGGER